MALLPDRNADRCSARHGCTSMIARAGTGWARFASLSRRLVRRDLPDLRRERVFGRFEIEARLNVHPERSASLEEFAEPQRSVGGHGLFFARDAFDPGAWHVQRSRDCVRCQLERNEKFLPENFAGMNRRKFLCHANSYLVVTLPIRLVIVDYLHVFGA